MLTKNIALLLVLSFIGASVLMMPVSGSSVEAGSSVGMSVVNMQTTANTAFVLSGHTPVGLNYYIRITDLNGVPSKGKVSSFMEAFIQEGRCCARVPFETIEFKERDTVEGHIYLYDKEYSYGSGIGRS
jgi:hypothetical protein